MRKRLPSSSFLVSPGSKKQCQSNIPTLPHTRCNWLLDRLLLGAAPTPHTLSALLDASISVFVNLSAEIEWDYHNSLPGDVKFIHFPIPSGGTPPLKETRNFINELLGLFQTTQASIYVHCNGGHGRTGLIGAILYGTVHKVSAPEAIRAVEESRETRIDTSRNFIPTPETNRQIKFVGKYLGFDEKIDPLPDRSDRSWLARVRRERKNQRPSSSFQSLSLLLPNTLPSGPSDAFPESASSHEIRFYTDAQFPEFSNYYRHKAPVLFEGKKYPTAEHIFQSAKFNYPGASEASLKYSELIRLSTTPNIARELASQKIRGGYPWRTKLNPMITEYLELGVQLRPDWDQLKDKIMKSALIVKFNQDQHCRQVLLSTAGATLIEHTRRDSYWGNGGDDTGLNRLGKLLMEVRFEISCLTQINEK